MNFPKWSKNKFGSGEVLPLSFHLGSGEVLPRSFHFLVMLGKDHYKLASSYTNIGYNYILLEKFDLALDYLNRSLAIYLQIFGNFHPRVALVYYNIANLYIKRSMFVEALNYFQMEMGSLVENYNSNNCYSNPSVTNSNVNSNLLLLDAMSGKAETLDMKFGY